jgi:hypothetical protein
MNDTVVSGHNAIGGATARGKPDLSVKVPAAVKAAADRAEALVNQAKEKREQLAATGQDQPVGVTQQPPPPVQPQGVVTATFDPRNPSPPTDVPGETKPRVTQPPVQQTQPPPVRTQTAPPVQTQTPPPVQPQPQNPEDWEHQFRSIKGRYEQEAATNRRLTQQVTDMQRLLASVSGGGAPHPGPPSEGSGVRFTSPIAGGGPQPPVFQRKVTPKEIADFGEDTLDVMGRRAQEVLEPVLAQVFGELQHVKRQLGGVQNTVEYDARVQMYRDLEKEVPNWNDINNHPAFLNWLDQVDPISRQTRRSFLVSAHNSNVSGQVVDIFKGFLADQAARGPVNGGLQPGNGSYSQSNPSPQVDLTQFAAPGRAKTGQTEIPPEKPIFNAADITQFYRDKVAGRYAGREAEMNQIEAQLYEAGREGRVRR